MCFLFAFNWCLCPLYSKSVLISERSKCSNTINAILLHLKNDQLQKKISIKSTFYKWREQITKMVGKMSKCIRLSYECLKAGKSQVRSPTVMPILLSELKIDWTRLSGTEVSCDDNDVRKSLSVPTKPLAAGTFEQSRLGCLVAEIPKIQIFKFKHISNYEIYYSSSSGKTNSIYTMLIYTKTRWFNFLISLRAYLIHTFILVLQCHPKEILKVCCFYVFWLMLKAAR